MHRCWPYKVRQPQKACIKARCIPRPSRFWSVTFGVFSYPFSSVKTPRNTIFLHFSAWTCIRTTNSFRSEHGCSWAQDLWYCGGAWAGDFSWEGAQELVGFIHFQGSGLYPTIPQRCHFTLLHFFGLALTGGHSYLLGSRFEVHTIRDVDLVPTLQKYDHFLSFPTPTSSIDSLSLS